MEALRCDIRRREWENAARKALAGKSSLTALQEALSDAPTMAATDSPLLKALRCHCVTPKPYFQRYAAAPCQAGSVTSV